MTATRQQQQPAVYYRSVEICLRAAYIRRVRARAGDILLWSSGRGCHKANRRVIVRSVFSPRDANPFIIRGRARAFLRRSPWPAGGTFVLHRVCICCRVVLLCERRAVYIYIYTRTYVFRPARAANKLVVARARGNRQFMVFRQHAHTHSFSDTRIYILFLSPRVRKYRVDRPSAAGTDGDTTRGRDRGVNRRPPLLFPSVFSVRPSLRRRPISVLYDRFWTSSNDKRTVAPM